MSDLDRWYAHEQAAQRSRLWDRELEMLAADDYERKRRTWTYDKTTDRWQLKDGNGFLHGEVTGSVVRDYPRIGTPLVYDKWGTVPPPMKPYLKPHQRSVP